MNKFGKIIKNTYNEKTDTTRLVIDIPDKTAYTIERQRTRELEIILNDPRIISNEQRKKAYATINDIADYTGNPPEYLKEFFKYELMAKTGISHFSLSNCSKTVAREYINLIIDTALEWGIPLSDLAINRTDDIDRYLYKCLETRTCAITGKPNADVHHVLGSRVGMGRNRKKISHNNLKLIALSREWHTKVHAQGEEDIFNKYRIYGITVDRVTLKKLGLKTADID